MENLGTLVAFALVLAAGCESPEGLTLRDREKLAKTGRAVFGNPIALPGTDQVMFPFAVETDQDQKLGLGGGFISSGSFLVSGSSGFGGGGSSSQYYGGDRLSWNNVAFYDPKSAKSRL